MKKLLIVSVALLSISNTLTGCNPQPEPEENFVEKEIPIYGYDVKLTNETATCRFYESHPTIPYIDINTYQRLLLNKEVTVSKVKNDVYKIKTFKGEADIDVRKDILTSNDYNQFINTTIYRSGDSYNVYFDGAPYIKVSDHKTTKDAKKKTIDFSKYKIDFKYDNDTIWAPLITYSDMFKGPTMIQSFYDGTYIYLVDSNRLDLHQGYVYLNYYDSLKETFFKDNVRDAKVAELSYYEMCFNFDNYFGYPGRSPLEEMMKQNGLDYALSNYSDSTRLTRKYLLSTDISEYIAGMSFLQNLMNDGGHTVVDQGAKFLVLTKIFPNEIYENADKLIQNSGYEPVPDTHFDGYQNYIDAREVLGYGTNYTTKGDTFIYSFNSFDIDYANWNAYYENKTNTIPSDTVGNFFKGIELAKQNPEIKNFVVDLTGNLGGFGDVVMYLIKAMSNKSSMYFYDYIDEREVQQDYLIDVNLDRKFDELDNEPLADFNFGLLTSKASFSCGNLLPALAKDYGIPLIGEITGGGGCAVLENCSMEGVYYRTSSFLHFTNTQYESIDSGVGVDYNTAYVDGVFSFENMFDLDLISEIMNSHYSK